CLATVFFFNDTATTEIYTLSLHDALPISDYKRMMVHLKKGETIERDQLLLRSEEHTSALQSIAYLVCRLLLEKNTLSISMYSTATICAVSVACMMLRVMW